MKRTQTLLIVSNVARIATLLKPRILFAAALGTATLFSQVWVAQGPGPTLNGQNEGIPGNPVSGSIISIATSTNADLVYVGTTNGGVWKTTNATSATPAWTALTDTQLPALSISSLAISPLDANTLYAGTGSTSSLGLDGSSGFGVAKSTNGGTTWSVLAGATFSTRRIVSIVPTSIGAAATQVVLAATLFDRGGVYRSADAGSTFTRISGGSGLPDGGVSQIVADPSNANRFFAGVPSNYLNSGTAGIYVSIDGGANWTLVNGTIPAAILNNSLRILLSVSGGAPNPVYAMFISNNAASGIASGHLSGVFRTPDQGATWVSMGLPSPEIFPGGQGSIHGAILAHRIDAAAVFISGDRQNTPFPNVNGCSNFTANVFRGVFTGVGTWTNAVCSGASGTSPHADSRALAFDANGNVLQANDGGIFRLVSPDAAAGVRSWVSVNNTIQPAEVHSVAYDPLSNVVFAGTQDTGTPIQSAPGNTTWNELIQGDGGVVAVDADQTAHAGTSIRYTSFQRFGSFNRTSWNSANAMIGGFTTVGLNITSGSGAGNTLSAFDANIQFYTPYVLNRIDPSRMLIGTASIYESLNKGDSLANLGFTGQFISSLTYGSRLGGVAKPEVFYAGAGASIRHRVTVGGLITTLASYPGSSVRAVVMDPQNYQKVFAVDDASRVWGSFDEGVTWINLTANLPALTSDTRSIEIYSPDTTGKGTVLMVGTITGVFKMNRPGAAGTAWIAMGMLPHALVRDIHYDYTNNRLVAGLLGRGAWLANDPFGAGGVLVVTPAVSTAPILLPIPPPPPTAPPSAAPSANPPLPVGGAN